jgi:predicted phage-related endonuclease
VIISALGMFTSLALLLEAEQVLTNKLKEEHATLVASYEARLKQLPSSSGPTVETERVKDEPIDCDTRQAKLANHALEVQIVKDRLEQAQIDLGRLGTFSFTVTLILS